MTRRTRRTPCGSVLGTIALPRDRHHATAGRRRHILRNGLKTSTTPCTACPSRFTAATGRRSVLKNPLSWTSAPSSTWPPYKDWLDYWSNDYNDWLNNHKGKSSRNGDLDGDRIPNYIEDANLNGIYDSGDLYDWENYNTPTLNRPTRIINDFEDWNCKRHTNVVGNHSVDWANPGMQHNTKDNYND